MSSQPDILCPDILCIGSVLWDVIGRCSAKMGLGHDVPGRIKRHPGGVALNIALALRAYGMRPALLSVVGNDAEGRELLRRCQAEGMITDHVHISDDLPTDIYMAIEGANGLIAAIADAHSLEDAGDLVLQPLIHGALQGWSGPVAVDGNLTVELLTQIAGADTFAQTDLRIAPASPGKAKRLAPFLSSDAATLYVNLVEAQIILDQDFDTSEAAARALLRQGLGRAVVTNGAAPATVADNNDVVTLPPPAVEVVRITGAGDTFMAAHIAAEAQGLTPQSALKQALDATAIYVSGETYA